jgi:hypothetical protein
LFSKASALVVVVVIAVAAVGIPALSASGEVVQTLSFKEVNKGSTFHYVDNAPVNKKHARPSFSAGDDFVFTSPIAGDKTGELRAKCTAEHKAPGTDAGFNASHPLCTGAFVLNDGVLFVAVATGQTKVTHGAVEGGTGAYANARGTFTSTTTKTGSDDVVTLVS